MTRWTFPVDIKQYDTDPALTEEEKSGLCDWVAMYTQNLGHSYQRLIIPLARLCRPLLDVGRLLNLRPKASRAALHLLLIEMHRTGKSFWAWTADEWVQFINAAQFSRSKQTLVAIAYLLCEFTAFDRLSGYLHCYQFATAIFGLEPLQSSIARVTDTVLQWGYSKIHTPSKIPWVLCRWFLENHSPFLEDLTFDLVAQTERLPKSLRFTATLVSRVLRHLDILDRSIELHNVENNKHFSTGVIVEIHQEWVLWAKRWRDTSTLQPRSRHELYLVLLQIGRWLQRTHPQINSPTQWTRELAAEYVAAVDRMRVGEFAVYHHMSRTQQGKPLTPRAKDRRLSSARRFFFDCLEWGWIPIRFDPARALRTPRSIRAKIGPDPRVIADDIWAKLLWAGLNVSKDDLPHILSSDKVQQDHTFYVLEMVRAVTLLWLFAGLRLDEILRLRVGCVGWHSVEQDEDESRVCLLHVPVNKTTTAFTKPVSRLVGQAIETWERLRPLQPDMLDHKTGEYVQYLFAYRGVRLGRDYINRSLIPLLCGKAGIPERDARGAITSHRARATIASQLANAKEPLSLLELQQWLGHRSAETTRSYVKVTQTTLTRAYTDAGYLDRNLRTIRVLLDRDVLQAGVPVDGKPYLFYDLGHGYCTYDFFDKCPHRMACAKCSFYRPKGSSYAQLLEAKANLQRMMVEIPLTDEERTAVEDGVTAVEQLCAKLVDVPTPEGLTPRQLNTRSQSALIPPEAIK